MTFPDVARFSETYGFVGNTGNVNLEGQLFRPATSLRTLYLFMHPSSTLNLLPMPGTLADAGLHVLCAASRYPKNDSALIVEKVAIDLRQWVAHAHGALEPQGIGIFEPQRHEASQNSHGGMYAVVGICLGIRQARRAAPLAMALEVRLIDLLEA